MRLNPDMKDQGVKFSFLLNNAWFEINPNFDTKSGSDGEQTTNYDWVTHFTKTLVGNRYSYKIVRPYLLLR